MAHNTTGEEVCPDGAVVFLSNRSGGNTNYRGLTVSSRRTIFRPFGRPYLSIARGEYSEEQCWTLELYPDKNRAEPCYYLKSFFYPDYKVGMFGNNPKCPSIEKDRSTQQDVNRLLWKFVDRHTDGGRKFYSIENERFNVPLCAAEKDEVGVKSQGQGQETICQWELVDVFTAKEEFEVVMGMDNPSTEEVRITNSYEYGITVTNETSVTRTTEFAASLTAALEKINLASTFKYQVTNSQSTGETKEWKDTMEMPLVFLPKKKTVWKQTTAVVECYGHVFPDTILKKNNLEFDEYPLSTTTGSVPI